MKHDFADRDLPPERYAPPVRAAGYAARPVIRAHAGGSTGAGTFASNGGGNGFDHAATRAAAIEIGDARLRELWSIARLQRRAFRPPLAYGLGALLALWFLPHVRFFVARQEGQVVGCAIGDQQHDQSRVINLCVDPAAQRRGIGRALLRALETALPHGNIILMVEEGNDPARRLYYAEGYRPVGFGRDYYGRGEHGIWMQKTRVPAAPPRLRV